MTAKCGGDALLWEKRQARDEEECARLCAAIAAYETHGLQFALTSCGRCEAILTVRGHPSRDISDVDPFYNNTCVAQAQALAESPHPHNARRTADALNALSGLGAPSTQPTSAQSGTPGARLCRHQFCPHQVGRGPARYRAVSGAERSCVRPVLRTIRSMSGLPAPVV